MSAAVDWFRVLADMKDRGWSLEAISAVTGIPKPSLNRYRSFGAQPRYDVGERLLILWCGASGQMRSDAPIIIAAAPAATRAPGR